MVVSSGGEHERATSSAARSAGRPASLPARAAYCERELVRRGGAASGDGAVGAGPPCDIGVHVCGESYFIGCNAVIDPLSAAPQFSSRTRGSLYSDLTTGRWPVLQSSAYRKSPAALCDHEEIKLRSAAAPRCAARATGVPCRKHSIG